MSFAEERLEGRVSSQDSASLPAASGAGLDSASTSSKISHVELRKEVDQFQTVKVLLAGGVSGAVSKTVTAPLARMTILYQIGAMRQAYGPSGLAAAVGHVVRREGVLGLWRGNGVTMIHRLPYTASSFFVYEQANQTLAHALPNSVGGTSAQDSFRRLIAGGFAGSVGCAVAYPLDLVRTRLAAQTTGRRHGILETMAGIVQHDGLLGLYRGLGPTLLQAGPNLAINYSVYESLRSRWLASSPGEKVPPVSVTLVCGSLAGIASSTITFPLDVIRRRMQMQGVATGVPWQYTGVSNAVADIARKEGFRGLYSGLLPEYIKVAPGVAITYCTYEVMKSVLLGKDFNSRR